MEAFILSKCKGKNFPFQPDEYEDFPVEEGLKIFLDEFISDVIDNSALGQTARGYFPNPDDISAELFDEVYKILKEKFGDPLLVQVKNNDKEEWLEQEISLSEIIDEIAMREQGTIHTGALILVFIKNFLQNGCWHIGFQKTNGSVLVNRDDFPSSIYVNGHLEYHDGTQELEPIIWFGLKNEPPIKCWTINKSQWLHEKQKLYLRSSEPEFLERWEVIWGEVFWCLDWNTLFDGNGHALIIWMFSECDMEEPVEEFQKVKETCPIDLDKIKSADDFGPAIDKVFKEIFQDFPAWNHK